MSQTRPPVYDDRYAAPLEASRRGAHRARPGAASAFLPVIGGLAVVIIVIAVTWTLLGRSPDSSPGTAGADPTSTATLPASETHTAKPTATEPSTPTATGTPSSSTTSGTDVVDFSLHLSVINTVGKTGLAGRVVTTLKQDGWTSTETGNSTLKLTTTKVYYGRTASKASAQKLVDDLGFGSISKSSTKAGTGIRIELGDDASSA